MTQTLTRANITKSGLTEGTRRKLVRLIVVALLIPLSFEVASFRLTPSLLVMIGLFPLLTVQYFKKAVVWRLPDFLFFFFVLWQGLTILINNPERVVAFTGQQALLTLAGFLAGRLLVINRQDFYNLIVFVGVASMISMPFALYESVFDDPIILRLIADYTPFDTFRQNNYEPRLGLYRAQFVFAHPIHFGLLGALALVPFLYGLKGYLSAGARIPGSMLIGAACFLSVSSGAVLSVMLQLVLFIWHSAASRFQRPWRTVLISGSLIYAVLEVASNKSAFVAISSRLAFNSSTAYYRTLIWEFGTQQVRRTPFFGNGYNYWERPFWMLSSSVDNHWLLLVMVHGIPAVLLFAGSMIYAFVMVNRPSDGGSAVQRLRLAWTLTLIGFAMSASTVAIWGEIQLLFMLIFGAGFWMIGPILDPSDQDEVEETAPSRAPQYTRFATKTRAVGQSVSRRTTQAAGASRRDILVNSQNRRPQ
tara:strand:+ start:51587 stop:53014 length:1428 start_codon:yes stop_codon:yes gene_type:complete